MQYISIFIAYDLSEYLFGYINGYIHDCVYMIIIEVTISGASSVVPPSFYKKIWLFVIC